MLHGNSKNFKLQRFTVAAADLQLKRVAATPPLTCKPAGPAPLLAHFHSRLICDKTVYSPNQLARIARIPRGLSVAFKNDSMFTRGYL
jgi:hypothetical protein